MTIYDLLMAFGAIVVVGIIVKGFLSATRIKPIEQPDNLQNLSDRSPGGD